MWALNVNYGVYRTMFIAYGNNFPDWTSLDPAIVSYRQFSFMNGPNQAAGGDMFLSAQQQQQQQMNQQQNLQPGQGMLGEQGFVKEYTNCFKLSYTRTHMLVRFRTPWSKLAVELDGSTAAAS